nr:unnamed protein product [Callosobruchus chinensis]
MLYLSHLRSGWQYRSHIWGVAATTTLSILEADKRRTIRLIGDLVLMHHLQVLP